MSLYSGQILFVVFRRIGFRRSGISGAAMAGDLFGRKMNCWLWWMDECVHRLFWNILEKFHWFVIRWLEAKIGRHFSLKRCKQTDEATNCAAANIFRVALMIPCWGDTCINSRHRKKQNKVLFLDFSKSLTKFEDFSQNSFLKINLRLNCLSDWIYSKRLKVENFKSYLFI